MDWTFTLLVIAGFLIFQVLYMAVSYVLTRCGHGHFTLRDGLQGIIAFIVAGLAAGFFKGDATAVSSSPRMTDGMLFLVVFIVFIGVRFILARLWK